MQVSQGNSKNKDKTEKGEKKVSFSAVEAIERTTDSIERLASLMDKMDMKLDRREDQYRPRFIKVEVEDTVTGKITMDPEIDPTAETGTRIIIEEEETTTIEVATEITGPIIGITIGPKIETTMEMAIGTILGQITQEMTVIKGMVTEIRTAVDPGREIEIGEIGVTPEKVPNPGAVADPKTEMRLGDRVEIMSEIETGLNQDPNSLLM